MNQHIDDIPPFGDASHEREWLAQESTMRRERLHLDPAGDDARGRRYRLLARALREPLQDVLPADFAQCVAAQVANTPTRRPVPTTRFEFMLTMALIVALTVTASVVTVIYGNEWLPSIKAVLPMPHAPATRWLLALASCIGASWLWGQWQRHDDRRTS
jgi:hypothetical protein